MIEFIDVSKNYNNKTILKNLNFIIPEGKIVGIIGPSGVGKSTIVRLINGLETITSGNIVIPDNITISTIFQNHALLSSKTVYQNIELALRINKEDKKNYESKIQSILEYVDMSDKFNSYPSELSGGQKQRVGIARALVTNPSLLLCDEITSSLDPNSKKSILSLIKKNNREHNNTTIMVTHEMDVIKNYCDLVIVLNAGKMIEYQNTKDLFFHPKTSLVKSYVEELIFPTIPEFKNITLPDLNYLILTDTQYLHLQTSNIINTIYNMKHVEIGDEQFYTVICSLNNMKMTLPLNEITIYHERINNNDS